LDGFLDIVVSADDGAKIVSDSFRLTVTPVDDASHRLKRLPDDVI
jgi:hypothetical protein